MSTLDKAQNLVDEIKKYRWISDDAANYTELRILEHILKLTKEMYEIEKNLVGNNPLNREDIEELQKLIKEYRDENNPYISMWNALDFSVHIIKDESKQSWARVYIKKAFGYIQNIQ